MVVHNLHCGRPCGSPNETQPVLIVDADAVLASPVPFEGFKSVARGNSQVIQPASNLKLT